jgi:hypothetical protein
VEKSPGVVLETVQTKEREPSFNSDGKGKSCAFRTIATTQILRLMNTHPTWTSIVPVPPNPGPEPLSVCLGHDRLGTIRVIVEYKRYLPP